MSTDCFRMLQQGTRRIMDAADFGSFQPSVMTLCLPNQYHHHHHLSNSTVANSFRPYSGGNPSSSSAVAADLSLFSPMSDKPAGHYGGGPLSAEGTGSQPSHKLMSIIKSQAALNGREVDRIQPSTCTSSLSSKLRQSIVGPSSATASSPTRTVCQSSSAAASISHHFNLGGKEVSPGPAGMHPSLSPWFIQQQQQQQQQHKPIGSNKKRRQLSESASGTTTNAHLFYRPPSIIYPSRLIYKTDRLQIYGVLSWRK